MPKEVRPRSEMPIRYTWDVAAIFASDAEWEDEVAAVSNELADLARHRGHLGDGPAALADYLEGAEHALRRLGRILIYASNQHEVDTTDQVAAAMNDRAVALYARAMAAISFAEPEILTIGFATLRRWLAEEPRLAIYAHYVDTLERKQEHVRSAEVEELLSQVMDPFATAERIHGILADADLTFAPARGSDPDAETIPVAQGNIDALLTDPDREVRRTAWESYSDAHLAYRNTMANCLATGVKQNVFRAYARRYPSALEAALGANFIPPEVFRNVLDTFRRNLPVWHRYWRVHRQALGYSQQHVYDIKAPLSTNPPVVPFNQAVTWVSEGIEPLGQQYVSTMRRGLLEERWADVYPSRGKRAGAFSTGMPGTYPYVLLNYTDDLESLSTLAHEAGHSMHSYHTWESQPYVYSDYSIFVAEVASNTNQALVRDYLFRTVPDRDFQISLIEEAMSNFHRYLFLMPTLARFELEIHERVEQGQALTAENMMALMADLFAEAYGGEVVMDAERVGITWAEFSTHLYANFYVYQYTTGISAARALAEGMLAGAEGAVERYIAFLRAGSSLYPLDALKLAGVDMTSPEPVERAYAYIGELTDRLQRLLAL